MDFGREALGKGQGTLGGAHRERQVGRLAETCGGTRKRHVRECSIGRLGIVRRTSKKHGEGKIHGGKMKLPAPRGTCKRAGCNSSSRGGGPGRAQRRLRPAAACVGFCCRRRCRCHSGGGGCVLRAMRGRLLRGDNGALGRRALARLLRALVVAGLLRLVELAVAHQALQLQQTRKHKAAAGSARCQGGLGLRAAPGGGPADSTPCARSGCARSATRQSCRLTSDRCLGLTASPV